jgi:hypothetical protein
MMEMSLPIASLVALGGIVLLGLGAAWLVDGASRLALRFGISPMVVGLTVVGFGTSMPEFMVSVLAAVRGSGAMSVGNAVGSNVMNLWLVLGVSAMIRPMVVVGKRSTLARDLVFGLLPAGVLLVAAWNGEPGSSGGTVAHRHLRCVHGGRGRRRPPGEERAGGGGGKRRRPSGQDRGRRRRADGRGRSPGARRQYGGLRSSGSPRP